MTTNHTSECHFCSAAPTGFGSIINTAHWTGTEYIRINACQACCTTKVAAAPKAPRQPRKARQPRIMDAGGWVNVFPQLRK